MRILYALHPKSVPSKWQTSGDTNMAMRMLKHLPEGIEVDVFSDFSEFTQDRSDDFINLLERYNISGAVNSAPHIQRRTYLKDSMKFIRSIADQYDVIHFHNSNVASVHWMSEFFDDCETPLMYTMHTPPENSSFQFYHRDDYLKFGKNPKNLLIAVSPSHYSRVLNALQTTAAEMPSLTYVTNGIEYEETDPTEQDIDVIVVGRLDPTKDILHSLKTARTCSPFGKVVYIGDTTATSVSNLAYQKEVEDFIESEGIQWIRSTSNKQVQILLARSKAHIALSRIETYGLTVVEAQMQGTPVLGFDAGGIGDNIIPGLSGAYVEAKGSWKKRYGVIAEQYKEVIGYNRKMIKANAQAHFDIASTTYRYLTLYKEVGVKLGN